MLSRLVRLGKRISMDAENEKKEKLTGEQMEAGSRGLNFRPIASKRILLFRNIK